MDSWASRLTVTPSANWTGQVSLGRLAHPEALEPGDIVRSTASVTYNRPFTNGNWASSVIWGRNHKIVTQRNLNGYTAESVLNFRKDNSSRAASNWWIKTSCSLATDPPTGSALTRLDTREI